MVLQSCLRTIWLFAFLMLTFMLGLKKETLLWVSSLSVSFELLFHLFHGRNKLLIYILDLFNSILKFRLFFHKSSILAQNLLRIEELLIVGTVTGVIVAVIAELIQEIWWILEIHCCVKLNIIISFIMAHLTITFPVWNHKFPVLLLRRSEPSAVYFQ